MTVNSSEDEGRTEEYVRSLLPLPGWNTLTEPYWRAAAKGVLVLPQCSACNSHRWEPTRVCYVCLSEEFEWNPVPGTGTLYTYTWPDVSKWPEVTPYNICVVELDGTQGEPVRLLSWVEGAGREDLACALKVRADFKDVGYGLGVPYFRLA